MRKSKKLGVLALGASLLFAGQSITAAPSYAGDGPPAAVATVVGGGGSSAGGWIVGGLFISVASIIACAMIVGVEEGREMTLEEALLSGAIPLGCLLREEFGLDPTP